VVSAFVCPLFDREATLGNGTGRSNFRGSAWIFAEATRRSDIYDGASQTLAIGETAQAHGWAVPGVVDMQDPPGSTGPLGSRHPGLTHFLFCDGSARAMKNELPPTVFAALSTPAGREPVGDF
jgi:prepilin-type processing-associated H-X9-DG protein